MIIKKAPNGREYYDLTGDVFGRYTVISAEYVNNNLMWLCECSCGTQKLVKGWALRAGRTQSCGCLHKDVMTKHGKSSSTEYKAEERLVKMYGITLSDYDEMLEVQGGICAICGTEDPKGRGRFHVDHDHNTGAVRGLLCHGCNTSLGHFKDDEDKLLAAVDYLRKYKFGSN